MRGWDVAWDFTREGPSCWESRMLDGNEEAMLGRGSWGGGEGLWLRCCMVFHVPSEGYRRGESGVNTLGFYHSHFSRSDTH